ncbi:MAG: alpha/beta hydrolase family protein [Erythrobacter sp.]
MKPAISALALAAALAACAPTQPVVEAPKAPDARFAVTDSTDHDALTVNALPADPPSLKVAYGAASARQYGELRMPQGKGPFPVAVIYHGGCWAGMGSTANVAPLASFLARNGVATWTPSYREIGSDGGWPNTFTDWAQGLMHVKKLAKTYPLDLTRITVMGHSAGVTPVMWLPSGHKGDEAISAELPPVMAAVALDGPLRIADFVGMDRAVCGAPVIATMMGGTPAEQPARYAMLDPHANRPLVRRLLVVDGALPDVDPTMIAGLRGQGIAVEVIRVTQDQHFNLLAPGTKDFATIAPALLDITGGR